MYFDTHVRSARGVRPRQGRPVTAPTRGRFGERVANRRCWARSTGFTSRLAEAKEPVPGLAPVEQVAVASHTPDMTTPEAPVEVAFTSCRDLVRDSLSGQSQKPSAS